MVSDELYYNDVPYYYFNVVLILENDILLYLTYHNYKIIYILLEFTFLDIFPL